MTWWDSFETLSKLQTVLAIFVSVLGVLTLTVKLRADQLKKQADTRRTEDRARLDSELQAQTAKALKATTELETRTRPKSLKERLLITLGTIDPRIIKGIESGTTQFAGDLKPWQFAEIQKLSAEPGSAEFMVLKIGDTSKLSSDGLLTPVEFTISQSILTK